MPQLEYIKLYNYYQNCIDAGHFELQPSPLFSSVTDNIIERSVDYYTSDIENIQVSYRTNPNILESQFTQLTPLPGKIFYHDGHQINKTFSYKIRIDGNFQYRLIYDVGIDVGNGVSLYIILSPLCNLD